MRGPKFLVRQVEKRRQDDEEGHRDEASFFAGHHLGFRGPHQEGRDVFGLMVQLIGVTVGKFDVLTVKRRSHGDPARRERSVLVIGGARFDFLLAGVTGQDGDDILGTADAFEELVDPRA